MQAAELEFLINFIKSNRFMPVPPPQRIFTGNDGDVNSYILEGTNAFRSLVQHGLKSNHRILDIGSGIGRVALPLTYYLTEGSYVGIDIVLDGVSWCRENISTKYPNFVFLHSDIFNDYYNPMGVCNVKDIRLPFEDNSFDFVFLVSVFTHLFHKDTLAYLDLISRILKPGGILWSTWFLLNDEIKIAIQNGKGAFLFDLDGGPDYHLPNQTTISVGYDEEYIKNEIHRRGLILSHFYPGNWSALNQNGNFQDLMIITKS